MKSGCHTASSLRRTVKWDSMTFSHQQHAAVTPCIDCHAQGRAHARTGPRLRRPDDDGVLPALPRRQAGLRRLRDLSHAPPRAARPVHRLSRRSAPGSRRSQHPVALGRPHRELVCEKCHTRATATAMTLPAGCVSCHAKRHTTVKTTLCAQVPRAEPLGAVDVHASEERLRDLSHAAPPGPRLLPALSHHLVVGVPLPAPHRRSAGVHATFPCERCHTNGLNAPGTRLHQLPRLAARRTHRLRALPHDERLRAVDVQPPAGRRARRRLVRLQRLSPAGATSPAPTAPATAAVRRRTEGPHRIRLERVAGPGAEADEARAGRSQRRRRRSRPRATSSAATAAATPGPMTRALRRASAA